MYRGYEVMFHPFLANKDIFHNKSENIIFCGCTYGSIMLARKYIDDLIKLKEFNDNLESILDDL